MDVPHSGLRQEPGYGSAQLPQARAWPFLMQSHCLPLSNANLWHPPSLTVHCCCLVPPRCASTLWRGECPDPPSAQQVFYHPFLYKQTATKQNGGHHLLAPCWQFAEWADLHLGSFAVSPGGGRELALLSVTLPSSFGTGTSVTSMEIITATLLSKLVKGLHTACGSPVGAWTAYLHGPFLLRPFSSWHLFALNTTCVLAQFVKRYLDLWNSGRVFIPFLAQAALPLCPAIAEINSSQPWDPPWFLKSPFRNLHTHTAWHACKASFAPSQNIVECCAVKTYNVHSHLLYCIIHAVRQFLVVNAQQN